jgi:tetratricopeptide (TPR) repeat protein
MSSADQEGKPAATPLDAEREALRKAGYTDAEVSQILVTRASHQTAGAATGQGVLSNVLSSILGVASHARGLLPTFRKDVMTLFDGAATTSARAGATASLAVKAIVVLVLGYAAWQEWSQHIISATEIAQSQARKIRAEECSARMKAIVDTVPVNQINAAAEIVQRDCDPTYAQRTAACSAKFNAILDSYATLSVDEFKAKVEEHKQTCVITDADRQAATAKIAAIEDQRKQRVAEITSMVQDTLKAQTEFDAGHYDEALKIESANAATTEAFETKTKNKPGDLTADSFGSLSWYALFARRYAEALDDAERSIKLKPNLAAETNRAHALMMLGRTADAKAIYLSHKGEPLNGKKWEEVIFEDFDKLRKAGIENPLMAEIEAAFKPLPAVTPPGLEWRDSHGKSCHKGDPDCQLCSNGPAMLCL